MKRAELQGARFAALHLRRMLVLLGLGIIHGHSSGTGMF